MAAKRIRVVAIDQHAILLEAMAALINPRDDMILVAAETTGERGWQAIVYDKPDVAVIASPLSDINCLLLTERIANEHPMTQVVILTMHEDRALLHQTLQVGAKAYVSKRSPVERLLEAITAAAEGQVYIDPTIAAKILGSPSSKRSSGAPLAIANFHSRLTQRETDTVRLVAIGYTGKEIAARLGLSVKSVEAVKSRASEKLDLRTRAQLVRYAAAQGWLSQL